MKHLIKSLAVAMSVAALHAGSACAEEIVVIVSRQNPATKMFTEQAAQFFLGKSSMFTPVDLPESSPVRTHFYQKVTGKDVAEVKVVWSKLVFTGKAAAPAVYRTSAEVKKAVAGDPHAIGYIEKSALDDSVKAILAIP